MGVAGPSIKAFIERFDALSPADKRDWLRVHFRFLQLEYERVTRDYLAFCGFDAEQQALAVKARKSLAAKYGYSEEEIVREKVKMDIAAHYGFSEEEVERLLDPSYKPEPLQFPAPQPAFDREWHKRAKPALTDAQVRAVVENIRAAGEVRQPVTETPMNRLEKFEQMTGVQASWCKP